MSLTARTRPPSTSGATTHARRAAGSRWIDRLARLGLVARGVVYVLVGYFAVQIAFGHASRQASKQGAFRAIASTSFGPPVLWIMAMGFFGYALWRLTEAIWGHRDEQSTAKRLGRRALSLSRTVVYAFVGYSAAALAAGGSAGSGGSDSGARSASARLMREPYGVPLLTVVGLGIMVAGAVLAYWGLRAKFEEDLKVEQMNRHTRSVVRKLGMAGNVARGAVFALVGIFVVESALTFDPHKARGLDGSLRTLAHSGWGKAVLVVVALGLVAFGVYSFLDARYRKTSQSTP